MLHSPTRRALAPVAWIGAALALVLAPLLAGPASAQRRGAKKAESAPPLAPFVGSLEEARASARERNVPLLIHIVLEGEEHNDEYRRAILPDEELRALCQRAVVVIANNGEHPPKTLREELEGVTVERQVCSVYEMFERCEQHRVNWDPLYFEYHEPDGEMRCPQTILASPANELAWRCNTAHLPELDELRGALAAAQKAAGQGLTLEELTQARRRLSDARLATKAEEWSGALRGWQALLGAVAAGPLHEEAKSALEGARAAMQRELDAVLALLVPGSAKQGYLRLVALEAELAGTPLEDDARKALAAAGRDKEIKDEVREAKLELEAQELFDEAQTHLRAGDERKAESLVRRLFRKKYTTTDVAQRARELYPEIAAEEDAKGG